MHYFGDPDVIVLALPGGAVPVAFEVAKVLHAPLDVFVVRWLSYPGHEHVPVGALAQGGLRVMNQSLMRSLHARPEVVEGLISRELEAVGKRERVYRGERPAAEVKNRPVILVDDGLSTGMAMLAAMAALRLRRPSRIIAALPVGLSTTCRELRLEADEVVCVLDAAECRGSSCYEELTAITDDQARGLLESAAKELPPVSQVRLTSAVR